MAYRAALTALAVLLSISCNEPWGPTPEYAEEEPNGDQQTATHLEEGLTFEGTIDDSRPGGEDTDYYRLRGHAGFVYRIEFEAQDSDLKPEIHVLDDHGGVKHIRFAGNGSGRAEFFEPFEGTLYFMVVDNAEKQPPLKHWRDGRYWLRVTKRWACEYPTAGAIGDGGAWAGDMDEPAAVPRIVTLGTTQGRYAMTVISAHPEYDKKLVLFDCLAGQVEAGSDDQDRDSGLVDPYLYEWIGGYHDHRLVLERWVDDLTVPAPDMTQVTVVRHDPRKELEPNDRFMYANDFDPAGTTGNLDPEKRMIEGVLQADRDVFRREIVRDTVARFSVNFGAAGAVQAEIWSSSIDAGGYTMVPLTVLNMAASAGEDRPLTVFLPFTGTLYLSLQGQDVPYTLIQREDEAPLPLDGLGSRDIAAPSCESSFFTWEFPPFINAVRIQVVPEAGNNVSLQVFDERHLPMLYLDGNGGANGFYLTRFSDQSALLLGVVPEGCDAAAVPTITLSVEEVPFRPEEPDFTVPGVVVPAIPDTTYIGWFDTDILLVENLWSFTPERDGTLFLMTTPVRERGTVGVDTVIRLYEEGKENPVAMNDDMIDSLPFQNYSFVRVAVTKNTAYTISVKPFMDASSNIKAMNIHVNYGLDVRFE